MRLFIAEKPELAKAIVAGLGGGAKQHGYYDCGKDKVTWCIGHMIELYDPEDYDSTYKAWSLESLPMFFKPIQFKPKKSTSEQLHIISDLITEASSIVHAGDPDPEGQLIVDELLDYFEYQGPVLRFSTNDNNLEMVRKSLTNMKPNEVFKSLYQSALARMVGDQVYGYNLTRAYTLAGRNAGYDGVLSVGRVQTPTLALIVNRDLAHENHQKSYYYNLKVDFDCNDVLLSGIFNEAGDSYPADSKGRFIDPEDAQCVLEKISKESFTVTNKQVVNKEKKPPLCFNIIKLQIEASKQFKYSPDQVMQITQDLREKFQLITYNGTDSRYLNEEQHKDAPVVLDAIMSNLEPEFEAINVDPQIKSQVFNNSKVSAHHAIIPTLKKCDISELSHEQLNIYRLVAKYYLAQFLPNQQQSITTFNLVSESFKFEFKHTSIINPGWEGLFKDDFILRCPYDRIKNDATVIYKDGLVEEKQTTPPKRYTFDTLLSDLTRIAKYVKNEKLKNLLLDKDKEKADEHGGIGTSRTRDVIISNLIKKKMIKKQKGFLISTPVARKIIGLLPDLATGADMTALWHEQQKKIEENRMKVDDFLNNLMSLISKQVEHVKANGIELGIQQHQCPKCESTLRKIKSKKKVFWGCSEYPSCDFTSNDESGVPVL